VLTGPLREVTRETGLQLLRRDGRVETPQPLQQLSRVDCALPVIKERVGVEGDPTAYRLQVLRSQSAGREMGVRAHGDGRCVVELDRVAMDTTHLHANVVPGVPSLRNPDDHGQSGESGAQVRHRVGIVLVEGGDNEWIAHSSQK